MAPGKQWGSQVKFTSKVIQSFYSQPVEKFWMEWGRGVKFWQIEEPPSGKTVH